MASVPLLSRLQPALSSVQMISESEPLLNLDLSLGGLFSMQPNGGANRGSEDSFSPLPVAGSTAPVSSLAPESCCSTQKISPRQPEKESPVHSQDGIPTSLKARSTPAQERRCMQAQARRDARKRRRGLVDGKLSKREKIEDFHHGELDIRPPSTSFFEFLKPGRAVDQDMLLIHEDGTGGDESIVEDSKCKGYIPSFVSPNGSLPGFCSPASLLAEARSTFDNGARRACKLVSDHSSVSNVSNDSMKTGNASTVSCETDAEGGPWCLVSQSSHRFPAEYNMMCKKAPNELKMDVKSVSRPSASSSSVHSAPSAPCESQRKCQPSAWISDDSCSDSYSQGVLSSQPLSCDIGDQSDSRFHVRDKAECDGNSNSSASEIENESIKNDQGSSNSPQWPESAHFKDEQVGQAGATAGCAYPFPVMPLPYPYGAPAPWSFPHSWFAQGLPVNALGMPFSHPPAVNGQLREESAKSVGGFPNPYLNFPLMSGSTVAMWLPVVPACMQAIDASPDTTISVLRPAESDQGIEEIGSSPRADTTRAVPQRKDYSISTERTEKIQPVPEFGLENPANESLKGTGSFLGDGGCSGLQFPGNGQPEKSKGVLKRGGRLADDKRSTRPGERQTASQNFLPADRQQSLPLEYAETPKKKKVVRFNSLSVAETKMKSDDKMIASQRCPMRLTSSDQSYSRVASKGSCFAARGEELQVAKPILNGSYDKNLADDARHSDGQIVDAEVDQEKAVQSCSGTSAPLKSALKSALKNKSVVLSQSIALSRVITRGLGPRGRTIHGVLYISPEKQMRLMCVCHGQHMSALEFVQHSGSSDLSNPERSILLESFAGSESDV